MSVANTVALRPSIIWRMLSGLKRLAVDIDGGAEDHVAAECLDFLRDRSAFALDEVSVPA